MDEGFELPVMYRNEEIHFPAELLVMGYIYKIRVDVFGTPVLFEADEERNFRAIIEPSPEHRRKEPSKELLEAIANAIESIVR
jgi:hypothetical protein